MCSIRLRPLTHSMSVDDTLSMKVSLLMSISDILSIQYSTIVVDLTDLK